METPGRKTLIVAPPTPAGSKTLYYVEDHLGTVRVVTDETGTKANAEFHDYEPFGVEIPPSTNVAENTHQYTGQERDAATQMDYMHFRFYGSNLGRFMRPDNVMGPAMNPQDWNRYSYVHGNPVNFNDPTGHIADDPLRDPESKKDDIPSDRSDSESLNKPNKEQQKIGSFEGSQEQAQKKANELATKLHMHVKGTSSDGEHWTFTVDKQMGANGGHTDWGTFALLNATCSPFTAIVTLSGAVLGSPGGYVGSAVVGGIVLGATEYIYYEKSQKPAKATAAPPNSGKANSPGYKTINSPVRGSGRTYTPNHPSMDQQDAPVSAPPPGPTPPPLPEIE